MIEAKHNVISSLLTGDCRDADSSKTQSTVLAKDTPAFEETAGVKMRKRWQQVLLKSSLPEMDITDALN